jgi:hypothetical protein
MERNVGRAGQIRGKLERMAAARTIVHHQFFVPLMEHRQGLPAQETRRRP